MRFNLKKYDSLKEHTDLMSFASYFQIFLRKTAILLEIWNIENVQTCSPDAILFTRYGQALNLNDG